jgi:hypothetical protein
MVYPTGAVPACADVRNFWAIVGTTAGSVTVVVSNVAILGTPEIIISFYNL